MTDAASAPTLYAPPEDLARHAHVAGRAAYDKLVAEAEADPEGYWGRLAREFVSWKQPFTQVLDASKAPFFQWFKDGTAPANAITGETGYNYTVATGDSGHTITCQITVGSKLHKTFTDTSATPVTIS